MSNSGPTLEQLTSLAKRRGFIFQGSEIYGGLAGTWDYGPLGVQLKRNIQNLWWKMFVEDRDDMYGLDSAILMNSKVWHASGHTGAGFADPLLEDTKNGKRYRADHLLEDNGVKNAEAMSFAEMDKVIKDKSIKSPDGNALSEVRVFNMMFETNVGPITDDSSKTYLRPENAQGMFVNFKNIVDSVQPNLPFGIAQEGRVFRNEISPREFVFRVREFDLMELEYFIEEKDWEKQFDNWHKLFYKWTDAIGLDKAKIHELEVPKEDRAHYSKRTIDFEYKFSFGTKEIGAVAYRTDFDLKNHQKQSGTNMEYRPKDPSVAGGKPFIPHVIEPTFGVDRNLLAVLSESYREKDGRTWLALPEAIAPIKYAVAPLARNKPELVKKAREIYTALQKKHGLVEWHAGGNIGKFYARSDEIGTPHCITVDFETLENDTITVRDRDTTKQDRVKLDELLEV